MSTDGIKCGKNEKLREVFFMISSRIREKLVSLHCELIDTKDPEKYDYLIAKCATELFNLVNCNEKSFFPDDEFNVTNFPKRNPNKP